ncbi:hypothetical protein V8G54_005948 [Vigna mungo]|uniref:Uncharacterized protein n=1 Tax=Vigna mungo TaxID=3915 RepID=A0AAQ3NY31_VIGMU
MLPFTHQFSIQPNHLHQPQTDIKNHRERKPLLQPVIPFNRIHPFNDHKQHSTPFSPPLSFHRNNPNHIFPSFPDNISTLSYTNSPPKSLLSIIVSTNRNQKQRRQKLISILIMHNP